MRMPGCLVTGVAVAAVLALPGQALAGTVTRTDAAITYAADPATGAAEDVTLGNEAGKAFVGSAVGVTSADCTATDANRVDCDPAPAFVVNLLGFADRLDGTAVTSAATLEAHGAAGDDQLTGTQNPDRLFGEDGGDSLYGLGGNDLLDAGPGENYLSDGPGDDTITGGPGNDTWVAGTGRDGFAGGDGTDSVDYRDRTAPVTVTLNWQADDGEPGEGDNVGADVEHVSGGSGADTLVAGTNGVEINGGGGNDVIRGGPQADRLTGDEGDDVIDSRDGRDDSIDCGPGNDTLYADPEDSQENCEAAPDRDGDGYPNEQDCEPDNKLVNPAATEIPGNDVNEDCKDGAAYYTMSPGFGYDFSGRRKPAAIRWKRFKLATVQAGDRIEVRCRTKKKGCAFKTKTRTVKAGQTSVSLVKLFKRRYLRVGAVVEVRTFRANQHARVERLKIVKGPKVVRTPLCIIVGATVPGPCPPPPG